MEEKAKEKILNVPNVLTIFRMLLIPVYWVLFTKGCRYYALGTFVLASATDLLDGYIARKYHLITNFGKMMDPLADKLMVVSIMLSWVLVGVLPWPALAILAAKELFFVIGGLWLLKKGLVSYAEKIGKIAQATMVSALILAFFGDWFNSIGFPLHIILLWCAVALTLAALVFYVRRAVKQLRELSQKQEKEL